MSKLNLGCGPHKRDGYINIDRAEFADLQLDLEQATLPFSDNSIDEIAAHQVMEHITNFIPLMNECHRVLKEGGIMHISVPHVPYAEAFHDPTHVRFFTEISFCYFKQGEFLFEEVGKTYGIKPFSDIVQRADDWNLKVMLTK